MVAIGITRYRFLAEEKWSTYNIICIYIRLVTVHTRVMLARADAFYEPDINLHSIYGLPTLLEKKLFKFHLGSDVKLILYKGKIGALNYFILSHYYCTKKRIERRNISVYLVCYKNINSIVGYYLHSVVRYFRFAHFLSSSEEEIRYVNRSR